MCEYCRSYGQLCHNPGTHTWDNPISPEIRQPITSAQARSTTLFTLHKPKIRSSCHCVECQVLNETLAKLIRVVIHQHHYNRTLTQLSAVTVVLAWDWLATFTGEAWELRSLGEGSISETASMSPPSELDEMDSKTGLKEADWLMQNRWETKGLRSHRRDGWPNGWRAGIGTGGGHAMTCIHRMPSVGPNYLVQKKNSRMWADNLFSMSAEEFGRLNDRNGCLEALQIGPWCIANVVQLPISRPSKILWISLLLQIDFVS